jgi:hypothetical protein
MASELAAALAKVQAALPRIEKRSTADTGSYSYDYANLADVSHKIMPLLGENGLAFSARPTINADGKFVLAYSLLHESGDREDGEYPLPNGTPQQQGSAISYARRYTLCAVTGVAPADDDDDGAAASEAKQAKQPRQQRPRPQTPRPAAPQPAAEGNGKRPPTTANLIAMHFKRLGIDDDGERHNWVARMAGRTELTSTSNLPQPVQERILDAVSRAKDIGKVQAWIDDQAPAS